MVWQDSTTGNVVVNKTTFRPLDRFRRSRLNLARLDTMGNSISLITGFLCKLLILAGDFTPDYDLESTHSYPVST